MTGVRGGAWRLLALLPVLVGLYLVLLGPFTAVQQRRLTAERLGLMPRAEVLQALCADFRELAGAALISRVVTYFGTMVETTADPRQLLKTADYPAMSRLIHAALKLDPYNADGYYFGQAILVWDAGQYRVANELLDYGMRHRSWDWQLPFFAGFNSAYFLKDRAAAAAYYRRAGELSGQTLLKNLAGRYLQEAGETQLAIDYLRAMAVDARDEAVRRTFTVRIAAFEAVLVIEQARDRFRAARGRLPATIDELLTAGYLVAVPVDPYGGSFSFDTEGRVVSSSKFAFTRPAKTQPIREQRP